MDPMRCDVSAGQPAPPTARLGGLAQRIVGAARRRLRSMRERSRLHRELAALGDDDLNRVLAETGLSRAELITAMRNGPEVRELLDRMLRRVNVSPTSIVPAVWPELERRCALCATRRRCRDWLDRGSDDTAYRTFCPNAPAFDSLRAVRGRE